VPDVDVLTLVFAILLVFVLNQSDVRHAFGITRQQNDPSTIKPLRSFDVN
jgi:hypothetical protein